MNKDLHISIGSITDAGLKKEFNTDTAIEFKILHGNVFIVCDGHDGETGHGALASKLVSESIKKYFYNRSYKDMAKTLTNAITYANIALFEQAQKDGKYNGIASTLAIAIFREGKLYYAYAGDSRIYLYRENKLQALTHDHVEDHENATNAEVKVLLGKTKDIKFGVCKNPLTVAEGDLFLLCTDGLTDQLSEDEIFDIVSDADMAPEHKCIDLIEFTKEKGGSDCTSVQILEFNTAIEPQKKSKKHILKPLLYTILGIIGISALTFGAIKGYEAFKNRTPKEVVVEKSVINSSHEAKTTSETPVAVPVKTEKQKAQPAKVKTTKIKEPKVNELKQEPVYYNHKIAYGENLYRLALRYNITQKRLIDINGNKAKNLVAGSRLKIPVKAIHKVKAGESFSVISDKYNVKIKMICQASKISESESLKEGQTLVIPLLKKHH
ncbi:MAG: LysM peptidoglycan-binding domain-containing protein [Salinivirgaceae bacterium]|jgi:serine/threonine protein phosphatase PrpC/LysM repeat protein|nr:LysM peptidoglycan-binding domain-containing protein [Salinivirgaceae bacterium]